MKKVRTKDELLEVLKSCREGLTDRFGVIDLAVFGSYAKELQKKRSDVDILELKRHLDLVPNGTFKN